MPHQPAVTVRNPIIVHGHLDRAARTHQHDQLLRPRNRRIQQIALQHPRMLRDDRNHDGGIFAALATVDADRKGVIQIAGFLPAVDDGPPVHVDLHLLFNRIDVYDPPDVAVVHVLFVIVARLDDFVAHAERLRPDAVFYGAARRVEYHLQTLIERHDSHIALIHRSQYLHVVDRIQMEFLGDAILDPLYHPISHSPPFPFSLS